MRKAFFGVVSLAILVVVIQTWAQAPPGQYSDPSRFHLAKTGQPIAGIPFDEAQRIFDRHVQELHKLPGTISVNFTAEGLVVRTANPETLPPAVEGLPIFAIAPVDPDAVGALQKGLPPRPSSLLQPESTPHPEPPHIVEHPSLPDCPSGMHRESGEVRCRFDTPSVDTGQKLILNPPPPGVIVLKPGKVQEQEEKCPEGFAKEVEGYGGWRFCVDPNKPEPIPDLWSPPIAGIPYEKVLEIHSRHVEELGRLPGVLSAGLGADGIHVYTTNPDVVPKEIEGVPVKVFTVPEMPGTALSHTYNTFVRPLHGAVTVTETTLAGSYGTLTGIALADGKPWLIFPAHFLGTCDDPPQCNASLPLNQCEHYNTGASALLLQPVTGGVSGSVGWSNRWTPISSSFYSPDIAAAFLDSDFQEGNGSLAADRKVHDAGNGIPFLGTPIPSLPPVGLKVRMRSSIGPPHELQLEVQETNTVANNIVTFCRGGALSFFNSQIRYKVLGGYTVTQGDSGSPVFDLSDRLVGMLNACYLVFQPGVGYVCDPNFVFGTDIISAKNQLKYDTWYGTNTVNDNSIGTFYTPTAGWTIDNGNGKWDGPNCLNVTDTTPTDDYCFTYGTPNGDRPVTGDWNNDGSVTVGVYRTTTNPQQFLLRDANSGGAPNYTISTGPPSFGYKPVAGKWNGVNQTAKVGIFNPGTAPGSQRGFYLDNGDKLINGCPGPDHCFYTGSITLAEDIPIAGDWDNNGSVTIGVFRPSTSTFYLSNADPAALPDNSQLPGWNLTVPAGSPSFGYLPAVGDWTGPSSQIKTKLGVFRPSNGTWYLDNGNQSFPGCAEDQCPSAFGGPNQLPVSFGQTKIKAN